METNLWIRTSVRAKTIYGLLEQQLPKVLTHELDDLQFLTIGSTRYLLLESDRFSVLAESVCGKEEVGSWSDENMFISTLDVISSQRYGC